MVPIGIALSFLAVLFSYLLIFVEGQKFINFLYSSYHIDRQSLPDYINFHYFLMGILILGGVSLRDIVKPHLASKRVEILKSYTEPPLLLTIFSVALVVNVLKGFVGNIESEIYYYRINNYHFDERGKVVDLPEFKRQTSFINSYTTGNSTIIHPFQDNSPSLGNQVLLRYFLYPRILVSSPRLSDYLKDGHSLSGTYYILIKSYTEDIFYPDENFLASTVVILYKDNEIKKYSNIQFNQDFARSLGSFDVGLILRK
jgi:hypothetical protein